MFANFIQLITGRPSLGESNAFVQEVHVTVQEPVRREPRVERLILICWVLIAIKHIAVIWAVRHYSVPIHQLWINFPTWLLGALATRVYYARYLRR
ncbi:MAG: hypothetical protein ABIZ81_11135 [Opitutaceae bacterium]